MTVKRPAPRTISEFRREALRLIRERHPEATVEFATDRFDRPRRIQYPTGHVGFRARVTLSAPGYRTTSGTVTADADSIMFIPAPSLDVSGIVRRKRGRKGK